jgi:hypothetical protein
MFACGHAGFSFVLHAGRSTERGEGQSRVERRGYLYIFLGIDIEKNRDTLSLQSRE